MTDAKAKTMPEALMAAKKEFKPLIKNKVNSFTKSRYADLAAVLESIEEPLAKNGFLILQLFKFDEKDRFVIETKLSYVSSGEILSTVYELPKGVDSQAMGSAITYGRRYSLCALLSLAADDDDDGEGAKNQRKANVSQRTETKVEPEKPQPKASESAGETYMGPIKEVIEIKKGLWAAVDPTDTKYGTSLPEHADIARTCVSKKTPVRIVYRLNAKGSKLIVSIEPIMTGGKE